MGGCGAAGYSSGAHQFDVNADATRIIRYTRLLREPGIGLVARSRPPRSAFRSGSAAADTRPAGLDHRQEQDRDAEAHDRTDQSVGEEHAEATAGGEQRLAERLLGLVAEHDCQ